MPGGGGPRSRNLAEVRKVASRRWGPGPDVSLLARGVSARIHGSFRKSRDGGTVARDVLPWRTLPDRRRQTGGTVMARYRGRVLMPALMLLAGMTAASVRGDALPTESARDRMGELAGLAAGATHADGRPALRAPLPSGSAMALASMQQAPTLATSGVSRSAVLLVVGSGLVSLGLMVRRRLERSDSDSEGA